ncbi:hypothetical protein CGRA01v4_04310 [Colletotrichum graminicola]|nr:hypothetical protein CGRA01v4_04310 [Colletotrichum graminicola]
MGSCNSLGSRGRWGGGTFKTSNWANMQQPCLPADDPQTQGGRLCFHQSWSPRHAAPYTDNGSIQSLRLFSRRNLLKFK